MRNGGGRPIGDHGMEVGRNSLRRYAASPVDKIAQPSLCAASAERSSRCAGRAHNTRLPATAAAGWSLAPRVARPSSRAANKRLPE